MGEQTDTTTLIKNLNAALPLLARDALAAATAAGTLPGPEGLALAGHLRSIAADELRDVEDLAARVAALGGTANVTVAKLQHPKAWRKAAESLLAMQRDALDAVVEAIPAGADDAEGEATEHLLEHVVARKREAIQLLERVLR
jgi:bacterioferritin (cytochrome b1)